ncbi:hypothetical protein SELSPUOL_01117, partial [Selenomonas sputigena ATCC 35185]
IFVCVCRNYLQHIKINAIIKSFSQSKALKNLLLQQKGRDGYDQ